MSTVSRFASVIVAMATGVVVAAPAEATFPDRNGRIAFVQRDVDATFAEIISVTPDGRRFRNLTNHPALDVAPTYSPDGRRIAFSSLRSQPPGAGDERTLYSELYVMNADGSHVRRLTHNVGLLDWQPDWSPDGRWLVFARGPAVDRANSPTDLWLMNLRSGEERQLTNSPGTTETFPQWSPDGERIAFEGDLNDPDNIDIYTIRPDGRSLRRLTHATSTDEGPAYSPDGRLIAFGSNRTGTFEVFSMKADGRRLTQLTDSPHEATRPNYSPDGRFIAYVDDGDPVPGSGGIRYPDVFVMRADGTRPVNLTRTPSTFEFEPDWQAR